MDVAAVALLTYNFFSSTLAARSCCYSLGLDDMLYICVHSTHNTLYSTYKLMIFEIFSFHLCVVCVCLHCGSFGCFVADICVHAVFFLCVVREFIQHGLGYSKPSPKQKRNEKKTIK